ncbi:hypothetical protein CLU79DRAFT_317620 [Phycomyces nitens]|nr:hypothetical protein CLU79DRAFT_317620 [Phycomyces nitens]
MLPIMLFSFLLLVTGVCAEQATSWISVNCTWPCSNNQECIVTSKAIECQSVHNSQWVLGNPEASPVFRGETAHLNQPCVVLPTPPLITTTTNTSSSSSTVILWPPNDPMNPTDGYLSDCDNSTFCAPESDMCVPRLGQDSVCTSTHQCITGLICTSADGTRSVCTKPSRHAAHKSNSKGKIGQRQLDTTKPSLVALESVAVPAPPQNPPPPPSPIYPPNSSTPSMQQQQLQRQLQIQHHYNQSEADTKNTAPPPPYVP